MTEEKQDTERKIIIDEDWKSQVQAEKERLAQKQASSEETAPEGADPNEGSPFPQASLESLITMLATQAMIALGQVPNPGTGKAEFQPDFARYLIDLLGVVEAKTTGNRTPEEIALLSSVLHELRLGYATMEKHFAEAAKPEAPPS